MGGGEILKGSQTDLWFWRISSLEKLPWGEIWLPSVELKSISRKCYWYNVPYKQKQLQGIKIFFFRFCQSFGIIFNRIHGMYKIITPFKRSRLVIYRTKFEFKVYIKKSHISVHSKIVMCTLKTLRSVMLLMFLI